MSTLTTIMHLVCLVLFAVSIGLNINTVHQVLLSNSEGFFKIALLVTTFSGLVLGVLFLTLQVDFIVTEQGKLYRENENPWVWLVFAYLLGIHLVAVAQIITALSLFTRCEGRRWYDQKGLA